MAKQVLDWSKRASKSGKVFGDEHFSDLKSKYNELQQALAEEQNTSRLREICVAVRNRVQQITKESGVPIEPQVQTALLDQLMTDPSIAYACVPGAGGDDAFACLRETKGGFQEYLKSRFCGGKTSIAVLPVSLLPDGEAALIIKDGVVLERF